MARANPQWKAITADSPALLICSGPQAYISPSWYAAKAEHGRVVPTWNYSAVHLSGTVRVHEDRDWLRDVVTRLTGMHEDGRSEPWQPSDAPERYIEGQLAGIVGLEITRHPGRGQGEAEPEPLRGRPPRGRQRPSRRTALRSRPKSRRQWTPICSMVRQYTSRT